MSNQSSNQTVNLAFIGLMALVSREVHLNERPRASVPLTGENRRREINRRLDLAIALQHRYPLTPHAQREAVRRSIDNNTRLEDELAAAMNPEPSPSPVANAPESPSVTAEETEEQLTARLEKEALALAEKYPVTPRRRHSAVIRAVVRGTKLVDELAASLRDMKRRNKTAVALPDAEPAA